MKQIFSEKIPRILKNKKRLEGILNIKITKEAGNIFIHGESEDEYIAEKVIDALNFGFPFSIATSIKKEDLIFEVLNIKDYTNRKDLSSVRARIIGKMGKTLKILSELTNCHFELKDNEVGIIGSPEDIKDGQESIISIIRGAKQSNVYSFAKKRKITKLDSKE